MFALNAYLDKVYDIRWFIKCHELGDLENLLHVDFEAVDDYYVIKTIRYTVIDILLALETIDFTLKKENGQCELIIRKI